MSVRVLFGSVAITREYCKVCDVHALVIGGKLACCDSPTIEPPICFKREIQAAPRSKLSKRVRDDIIQHQENRCLYCGLTFGAYVERNGKWETLKIHWDHMVPYSYTGCSLAKNMAASCHICNAIKHSKVFHTVEEASVYIATVREAKGFRNL